jgi:hypothetical protein
MKDFTYGIAAILGAILVVTGIDAYVFIREILAR